MLARVEISSATVILSPLRASVAAFWAAVGVEIPSSLTEGLSSLTEGLSSFAEGLSSFVEVPSMIVDANCMVSDVNCMVAELNCTVGDVIAMIAVRVGALVWWTGVIHNTIPVKLSLTAGHKKTISAVVEATALIVNGLTSGVGESYSLAGWKWS